MAAFFHRHPELVSGSSERRVLSRKLEAIARVWLWWCIESTIIRLLRRHLLPEEGFIGTRFARFYKMRPKAATLLALLNGGGGLRRRRVMGRRKAKCREATPVNAAKPPHRKSFLLEATFRWTVASGAERRVMDDSM